MIRRRSHAVDQDRWLTRDGLDDWEQLVRRARHQRQLNADKWLP